MPRVPGGWIQNEDGELCMTMKYQDFPSNAKNVVRSEVGVSSLFIIKSIDMHGANIVYLLTLKNATKSPNMRIAEDG